jgi:hypothetical protein
LRLILAATVCFLGVGLAAPIITLKKFLFIENTFSVLSGALALLMGGQLLVFLGIAGPANRRRQDRHMIRYRSWTWSSSQMSSGLT